ncbi:ABC transporter permease [Leucobacter sp. 1207-22]|uniref:ABC transporter permease n=1 Tax=Leucobacter sp. 1207-22 TaxID=2604456 RepID=UPI004062BA16
MASLRPFTYTGNDASIRGRSSLAVDLVVLAAVVVMFWLVLAFSGSIAGPIDEVATAATISTDPVYLPYYAGRSLLRMFIALGFALVFSFVYALIAARWRRAEMVMLPVLDVLQSVPVLGFLSVTLTVWLTLFPGTELGVECAAIFAIFTSQVWNMTFAFYQSLVTQPRDLDEAARLLRLTKWQRFWNVDVPHGTIPLVWNGMMSFGGGWFFLVASEMISVNNRVYALPGIGSYVAAASAQQEIGRLVLAIGVMVVMVLGVNIVFWRPLTAWVERFRTGDTVTVDQQRSVVLDLLRRSAIPGLVARALRPVGAWLDRATRGFGVTTRPARTAEQQPGRRRGDVLFLVIVALVVGVGLWRMLSYVSAQTGLQQFGIAGVLGLITAARVFVVVVLASLIWVPIGVWIGLHPRVTRIAQPLVQILASFPANFLFPLFTIALVSLGGNLNTVGILFMALGSQWYLLFNVIAGAAAIPNDLREAAVNLGLNRRQRWQTLYGPAVFASWVTGAIAAAGGAWNASIVAEVVSYGDTTITALGLGSYIAQSTAAGDFARTLVGVTVMSVFVVTVNRVFWRRMYRFAERRYSFT